MQSDKRSRAMIIFIGRILNAIPLRIATRQKFCSSSIQHFSGAEHIFRAGKQRKKLKAYRLKRKSFGGK